MWVWVALLTSLASLGLHVWLLKRERGRNRQLIACLEELRGSLLRRLTLGGGHRRNVRADLT